MGASTLISRPSLERIPTRGCTHTGAREALFYFTVSLSLRIRQSHSFLLLLPSTCLRNSPLRYITHTHTHSACTPFFLLDCNSGPRFHLSVAPPLNRSSYRRHCRALALHSPFLCVCLCPALARLVVGVTPQQTAVSLSVPFSLVLG